MVTRRAGGCEAGGWSCEAGGGLVERLARGRAILAGVGTYGSYRQVERGFSLVVDINIGSYSDHAREAVMFREREAALRRSLAPLGATYAAWFVRVLGPGRRFAGWLGALDAERTEPLQWDYRSRLPAPRPVVVETPGVPSPIAASVPSRIDVWLHLAARATRLAHGRALVGFTLAQLAEGEPAGLRWPEPSTDAVVQRLKAVARGGSFTDQPVLLARALVELRGREEEVAEVARDGSQPVELQALATAWTAGLAARSLTDAELERIARATFERRVVWTWVLVTQPASEEPRLRAALKARRPEPTDDSWAEFVGSR